jgi:hypothetical protein
MDDQNPPELSVIVVRPDNYETVRKTSRRLRPQNTRHLLEVVIVAASAERMGR